MEVCRGIGELARGRVKDDVDGERACGEVNRFEEDGDAILEGMLGRHRLTRMDQPLWNQS